MINHAVATARAERTHRISGTHVLWAAFVAQLVLLPPPTLLSLLADIGVWSPSQALTMLIYAAATLLPVVVWLFRNGVAAWLRSLPPRPVMIGLALPLALLIIIWLLPITDGWKYQPTLTLLWVVVYVAVTRQITLPLRPLIFGMTAALALLGIALLMTVASTFNFSPDEAHWADYASSALIAGGVYSRTWLMQPYTIYPGLGWGVAGYGWLLENIAFDIRVGRALIIMSYLLTFAGVYLLTRKLYDRRAALVSALFAALNPLFMPVYDYRPSHQLTMVGVFAALAMCYGNDERPARMRALAHAACGLIVTLALQLHAAAVTIAAAFSLYYLAAFVGNLVRTRSLRAANLLPIVSFAGGALVGSAIYIAFNVMPAGSPDAFLSTLMADRSTRLTWGRHWDLRDSIGAAMIVSAWVYILWRRATEDRILIGLAGCLLLALVVLDTQGYRSPIAAFYCVPVGVLLTTALASRSASQPLNGRLPLAALAVLVALYGQMLAVVNWSGIQAWIASGSAPRYSYSALAVDLRPLIAPDDVVVGTHFLVWTLPDQPQLYSYAGEITGMRRWGYQEGVDVWRRVAPTVFIDIQDQMTIGNGLQQYLDEMAFQECAQVTVQNLHVTLYRRVCATPSPG